MTTIDPKSKIVTLINTFTVKPENQDALIAHLNKATEAVMSGFAGFISANIHKGLEPNKVANYAQWQSKDHYMAVLRNPVALAHTATSKSDPDQAKDKGIGLTSTAAKCGRDVASPSNAEN